MKFLARNNLAFNLVNTRGTKDLFQFADPRLTVKTHTTFSRLKLPLLYENVKFAVDKVFADELHHCSAIAVSTDIWTLRSNDSYQSLTTHFINKSRKLQKFLMNTSYFTGKFMLIVDFFTLHLCLRTKTMIFL